MLNKVTAEARTQGAVRVRLLVMIYRQYIIIVSSKAMP